MGPGKDAVLKTTKTRTPSRTTRDDPAPKPSSADQDVASLHRAFMDRYPVVRDRLSK